jgi:hypothetical protein
MRLYSGLTGTCPRRTLLVSIFTRRSVPFTSFHIPGFVPAHAHPGATPLLKEMK